MADPPGFRRLWAAATVSFLGDGIHIVALPLLAAQITRDPMAVAAVTAAGYLPWLLLSVPSGVLVDRWDRRRVMWTVDLARAAVVGVLAVVAAAGHATIPFLIAVAFLMSTGETFVTTAGQAVLPVIVGSAPGRLQKANARLQTSRTTGRELVGAAVGGLLFSVAAALPFALNAVSFAASAALVATLAVPALAASTPAARRPGLRASLDGLRWLRTQPFLLLLAGLVGLFNIAMMAWRAVFVLHALGPLRLGNTGFGILVAGVAVGGILGSLAGSRLRPDAYAHRLLPGVLALNGLILIATGLTTNAVAAGALFAAGAAAVVIWNITTASLRQSLIPQALFGRVLSVYLMLGLGAAPLGAVLGGLIADHFGTTAVFSCAGGTLTAVSVAAAWAMSRLPRTATA